MDNNIFIKKNNSIDTDKDSFSAIKIACDKIINTDTDINNIDFNDVHTLKIILKYSLIRLAEKENEIINLKAQLIAFKNINFRNFK